MCAKARVRNEGAIGTSQEDHFYGVILPLSINRLVFKSVLVKAARGLNDGYRVQILPWR